MEPQVEIAQSTISEQSHTAASSQDEAEGEEHEPRPSLPVPVSDLADPTGQRILEESGTIGRILNAQALHPCLLRGLYHKVLPRRINERKEGKRKARRSLFEGWS